LARLQKQTFNLFDVFEVEDCVLKFRGGAYRYFGLRLAARWNARNLSATPIQFSPPTDEKVHAIPGLDSPFSQLGGVLVSHFRLPDGLRTCDGGIRSRQLGDAHQL